MAQSMTGFGRAEGEMLGRKLVVEARSVNHRFLDVRLFLPALALLLQQKDVIMNLEMESFSAAAWEAEREILSLCLPALSSSRAAEGEALARDLAERLKLLKERVGYVEAHARRGVEAYRERLMRRLKDLAVEADPIRLAQEVVLVAERSDVSEELGRLRTRSEE